MPWISRDKLDHLKREVKYAQQDTKNERDRLGSLIKAKKHLLNTIEDLSNALPQVSALVEVETYDYIHCGDFYYGLDRTRLDDLLASRDRKRQDEFAAEFDKK